jgi:hypothetical protein
MQSASAGWKQCAMPNEQAIAGQRISVMLSRIQHHFHHPFNIAVHGRQSANIHPQTAGDG